MYQTLFCLEILSIFLVYAVADYTVDTTKTSDTSHSIENSDPIDTYCNGSEWIAYKDEKCFKLIRKWATRNEAKDICKVEQLQSDSYTPKLVSIKSATEQEYLTNFVFNTSGVQVNIWIGARRLPENGNEFVWDDGSVLDFTNWAEGSPSEEIGRDCVVMQSSFTGKFSNISDFNRRGFNGKWRDVTCESGNYVLCEKLQTWPFPHLQKAFLESRKELRDTKIRLTEAENKIEDSQRNPVPIGFIYVQLPSQPEPKILWSMVEWVDVTSDYAGLFFRAEGGQALAFGNLQEENSPRLTRIEVRYAYPEQVFISDVSPGLWSNFIRTGGPGVGNIEHHAIRVMVSSGEVRPRNKAMRIWKRTS